MLPLFLGMPFEVYLMWRQYPWSLGELACDAKMLITETITYSSIFTIVAFSLERSVTTYQSLSAAFESKHTVLGITLSIYV